MRKELGEDVAAAVPAVARAAGKGDAARARGRVARAGRPVREPERLGGKKDGGEKAVVEKGRPER